MKTSPEQFAALLLDENLPLRDIPVLRVMIISQPPVWVDTFVQNKGMLEFISS